MNNLMSEIEQKAHNKEIETVPVYDSENSRDMKKA